MEIKTENIVFPVKLFFNENALKQLEADPVRFANIVLFMHPVDSKQIEMCKIAWNVDQYISAIECMSDYFLRTWTDDILTIAIIAAYVIHCDEDYKERSIKQFTRVCKMHLQDIVPEKKIEPDEFLS